MTRPAAPQAVCLTMGPQAWLASILASPGGVEDVDGAAQSALRRLHRRLRAAPWRLVDLSPGERAAMTWACETAALAEAGRYAGGRLLWLDFDRFLDDPRAGLTRAAEQFELPADAEAVEAVCSGPILTRYSKQPDVAFGPEDRKRKLDDARMRHVVEIRRGLNWLDRACADYPEIAAARAEAAAARD
jgi:hypothetical protein